MITTKIDLKKKVKLMSERQLWIIIIEFTDNTWGGPSSSGRSALCQIDRWTAITLRLQLECLSCTRLIFITCLLPLRFFSTADSFSLNNNAVRCYTTLLDSLNAAAIKSMTRGFYFSNTHLRQRDKQVAKNINNGKELVSLLRVKSMYP